MNRRNFLRGLMVGSVAAPIAAVAKVSEEFTKPFEKEPDIGINNISFQHTKQFDEPPCGISSGQHYIRSTYTECTPGVEAKLGVGRDGHLYAYTNESWKKLA